MGYLSSDRSLERRADPRRILPEVQSVLSVALPYSTPYTNETAVAKKNSGRIAAYAWGADYHDVFPARLQALIEFIEGQTSQASHQKSYTDTGPVLERDLAQRAGLGWIGKNTCLIHPRLGSYFLLGEILIDTALEPDEPVVHDYCGTCRRCIEACPTQCILPDRTIDAGRCISYLTIENKGEIPTELRSQMGNWIFGCDICQQVCPWNIRFASLAPDPDLQARPGVPQPDLQEEIHHTPETFNHKYKGSSVKRSHRRGLLRNVAVAMGNIADPACLPDLIQVLQREPEALVRGHAAWAIGQIGGKQARQALDQSLRSEPDQFVLKEIRSALGS